MSERGGGGRERVSVGSSLMLNWEGKKIIMTYSDRFGLNVPKNFSYVGDNHFIECIV